MQQKTLVLAIGLLASSAVFAADPDGGQLQFGGLVSRNTCIMHVNGGAQDATIQLETATSVAVENAGEVNLSATGAKPKLFSVKVDCSGSGMDLSMISDAVLKMASTYFGNSKGTLNNDVSVNEPAVGVNLAIHEIISAGNYKQVKVNDSTDTHSKRFDSDGTATFNFAVSYIKQNASVPVVAGFVKSNAAYTFEYR
ncbi:fimbrial protein [Pseudocitrobacter cyperus]|uniref:Fimbrial protein n=1 Tax=Pseudocitrobacter cyperus TaxID=3112843 RepID=A0ABV0HHX5_9ENTR